MEIYDKAEIVIIPACATYSAEYDVNGVDDFFDPETGGNILYDLQYKMEDENPDVPVMEIGEDYNFYEYPLGKNSDGTVHVVYYDMVGKCGKDNPDGVYRFVEIPETKAAVMMVKGPYNDIGKGFDRLLEWINENGYEVCGKGRVSFIHGAWDRERKDEYVNEVQLPVK